jgi:hypothetical protein
MFCDGIYLKGAKLEKLWQKSLQAAAGAADLAD